MLWIVKILWICRLLVEKRLWNMITAAAATHTAALQQLKNNKPTSRILAINMTMKRGDYIQAIRAMGEEPPAHWTLIELKVRLSELEEEHGVTKVKGRKQTSLQLWMVRLNEAKKRKPSLVEFAKTELGLTISSNATMDQITKEAVEKIYLISQPSENDPMGFGRHSSKSYREVYEMEKSYVEWAIKTTKEEDTCPRLGRFVRWLEMQSGAQGGKMDGYQGAPPPKPKRAPMSPESEASESSANSAQMKQLLAQNQAMFQTVMNAIGSVKEEVDQMKEERPRKKAESKTDGSFSMLEVDKELWVKKQVSRMSQ